MRSVTVFASSSAKANESYHKIATELGQALALKQFRVTYGAGYSGLMKALADGVIDKNGDLTGVIPANMRQYADPRLSENNPRQQLIERPDIEKRKVTLMQNTDVIIALPGGVGTFEELYEAVKLGKTVILLNHDHYYDALLAQHQHLHLLTATTVVEVISLVESSFEQKNTVQSAPVAAHSEDLQLILNTINATQDFIGFSDATGTFITVMEKSQHIKFQSTAVEPQDEIQHLFKFSRSIILFPYDSPVTFAILHKMLMYNQLGYNGEHTNGGQLHKRVILFGSNNTDFFASTIEQLKKACQEKLLVSSHCSGLIKANHRNVIELATDFPTSGIEDFCWWENTSEEQSAHYELKLFDHADSKDSSMLHEPLVESSLMR